MNSAASNLPVTAAEYLEGELNFEIRHEFVDGSLRPLCHRQAATGAKV